MIENKLVIAIDFDGTIVEHAYPGIGKLYDYAKDCINSLYDSGRYYIIIWSCRAAQDELDMIEFLNEKGVKYHAVNENCPEFLNICSNLTHGNPRKIYYDILVDDRSLWGHSIDFSYEWPQIINLIELEYKVRISKLKV
jgi:hypothetical protein